MKLADSESDRKHICDFEALKASSDVLLAEKNSAEETMQAIIVHRDAAVNAKLVAMTELDVAVAEKLCAIAAREIALNESAVAVQERDAALVEHEVAVAERDTATAASQAALTQLQVAIAEKEAAVQEKEAMKQELSSAQLQIQKLRSRILRLSNPITSPCPPATMSPSTSRGRSLSLSLSSSAGSLPYHPGAYVQYIDGSKWECCRQVDKSGSGCKFGSPRHHAIGRDDIIANDPLAIMVRCHHLPMTVACWLKTIAGNWLEYSPVWRLATAVSLFSIQEQMTWT